MSHEPRHLPVLPAEVLRYLEPAAGQTIVDATVGGGGHARLLAERLGPTGRLIVLDRDPAMLALVQTRLEGFPIVPVHAAFDQLRAILDRQGIAAVDGVLADLGVSSDQLDDPRRGLSFQADGPLDMRLDPTAGESARDLVNRLDEKALADIFYHYGEERFSRRIAHRIVETRKQAPIETTGQLADLVRRCVPRGKGQRIDPATRAFQGLRIAVNDELDTLDALLQTLPHCLRPGGRAVVISFHSLEDRRVKRAFADKTRWQVLTKKPVTASAEELKENPRARSAKLRAASLKGEPEA